MREFKVSDVTDIKKPDAENYKEIKPQNGMTKDRAMEIFNGIFDSTTEDKEKADTVEKSVEEYIADLKERSECPETIPDKPIDISSLERQPTEHVIEKKEEFDKKKEDLRKQWEEEHGRPWPIYTEDVYSNDGETVLRHAGDRYDMHHIQPVMLGGKNEVGNITPLHVKEHNQIHSNEGSCKSFVDKVGDK